MSFKRERSIVLGAATVVILVALTGCDQRNAPTPSEQPRSGQVEPPGTTPRNDAPAASTTPNTNPAGAVTAAPLSGGGGAPSANAASLTDADRSFVTGAAEAGMAEVEAGKLAESKASSSAVKAFAERMVKDHSKANEDLMALASKKGINPPAEPSAAQRATLSSLQKLSGAEFDEAYAKQMGVQAHQDAVALFERAAKDVNDTDIKAFAVATLPTLKEHLEMSQKLENQTMGGAKGS